MQVASMAATLAKTALRHALRGEVMGVLCSFLVELLASLGRRESQGGNGGCAASHGAARRGSNLCCSQLPMELVGEKAWAAPQQAMKLLGGEAAAP
jgi:hypothetical protein